MVRRLQEVILPGTAMNTSWLISMETLAANFADEFDIEVNYTRYRIVQILSIYSGLIAGRESAAKASVLLREKMRFGEWLRYGLLLYTIAKIAPKRYRARLSRRVKAASGSHPAVHMPTVEGKFTTILDVFEQVDQKRCEESISNEFMENG